MSNAIELNNPKLYCLYCKEELDDDQVVLRLHQREPLALHGRCLTLAVSDVFSELADLRKKYDDLAQKFDKLESYFDDLWRRTC